MRKSVVRVSSEKRSSVVARFGLVKPAPRKTIAMIGGVPCKLVGSNWVALKLVVK